MNLTPLVIERLIAKYPFLAEIPEDAPDGIDSLLPPAPPIDWNGAGHVLPVLNDDNEEPEEKLEDDFEDEDDERHEERIGARLTCWSDWALRIGADIMTDLREEIWKRLHYTTSAGVAHNKAMAKVSARSIGRNLLIGVVVLVGPKTSRADCTSSFCRGIVSTRYTIHRCKRC